MCNSCSVAKNARNRLSSIRGAARFWGLHFCTYLPMFCNYSILPFVTFSISRSCCFHSTLSWTWCCNWKSGPVAEAGTKCCTKGMQEHMSLDDSNEDFDSIGWWTSLWWWWCSSAFVLLFWFLCELSHVHIVHSRLITPQSKVVL